MSEPRIGTDCQIGEGVALGPNAVLHDGVTIGAGSRIGTGAVIYPGTQIGPGVTVFDNAVLGRPPQGTSSLRRPPGEGLAPLVVGSGCVIGAGAVIYAGTILGQEVLIGDLSSIREGCRVGNGTVIGRCVTVNCRTVIGSRVKIMDLSHVTADCLIEDDVFISLQVGMANDSTMGRRPPDQPADYRGPVIRRRAAIGAGTILVPGVEVGEGAMVAAGSLVNRSIPAWRAAAGVPVRILGEVPDRPEE